MSHTGLMVMLKGLFGPSAKEVELIKKVFGQKIKSVRLDEEVNALRFEMEDGTRFRMSDEGQSCCESRYMRTDDKLEEFTGATLIDAEIKPGPEVETDYDVHEIEFLEVKTDKGSFTVTNHNEHNGYHGGFSLTVQEDWISQKGFR